MGPFLIKEKKNFCSTCMEIETHPLLVVCIIIISLQYLKQSSLVSYHNDSAY